jgi:hypothetical protein
LAPIRGTSCDHEVAERPTQRRTAAAIANLLALALERAASNGRNAGAGRA